MNSIVQWRSKKRWKKKSVKGLSKVDCTVVIFPSRQTGKNRVWNCSDQVQQMFAGVLQYLYNSGYVVIRKVFPTNSYINPFMIFLKGWINSHIVNKKLDHDSWKCKWRNRDHECYYLLWSLYSSVWQPLDICKQNNSKWTVKRVGVRHFYKSLIRDLRILIIFFTWEDFLNLILCQVMMASVDRALE